MNIEQISGYVKVLAQARVEQQLNKPFFGKPYLKFGQCYILWSYFFQLGGILGARHNMNLGAFGHAFFGLKGDSGAINEFFTENEKKIMKDFDINSMKFEDYISAEFRKRIGYSGEKIKFVNEYFMRKVPQKTAIEYSWQYSIDGAAIGVIHPAIIQGMFERSNAAIPKEEWELARTIGLDIPPKQDLLTYNETVETENELFMAYCQACCPELHKILTQ